MLIPKVKIEITMRNALRTIGMCLLLMPLSSTSSR